jgi:hypothetical protein
MPQVMLHNTHRPEDCEALNEEWQAHGTPPAFQGRTFFCTCPSGEHGAFVQLEAEDPAAALASLPSRFRAGTRVYSGEPMTL